MQTVQDYEFQLIKGLIYKSTGIFLKDHKKTMVANRLHNRVKCLGLRSYKQYYDYITAEPGGRQELSHFINSLTTNETFFFRHHEQIDYCIRHIIPERRQNVPHDQPIRIWSAGCSSGEEPYSIAIMLDDKVSKTDLRRIDLLATDINQEMLDRACQGIYHAYALHDTPHLYIKKYFHHDRMNNNYQIVREIRNRVHYYKHNLLTPFHKGKFDMIFCRNVLIYFDKESKNKVLNHFVNHLKPNGFLILSYSESLLTMRSNFTYVRPSVYRIHGDS
ncbi:MAG TPA: methyltransferase domain-containing protein [bacterium]|nr:methyltransferase domain-containing protein [bacterium]